MADGSLPISATDPAGSTIFDTSQMPDFTGLSQTLNQFSDRAAGIEPTGPPDTVSQMPIGNLSEAMGDIGIFAAGGQPQTTGDPVINQPPLQPAWDFNFRQPSFLSPEERARAHPILPSAWQSGSPPPGGNIAQMAQQVSPTGANEPGPAAQIPFGPVQGQLTLLPQFNSAGQTRPFGPGESIALPNGMTANEMTWTVPMGGRWAVVPGLWLMNGVPTHLNAPDAARMATQSGLQWPFTFDSEDQANAYAEQRENNWEQMGQSPHMTTAQPPLWQSGK